MRCSLLSRPTGLAPGVLLLCLDRDEAQKSPQRTGCPHSCPGRLHQHAASVAATLFGNPLPDAEVVTLVRSLAVHAWAARETSVLSFPEGEPVEFLIV